MVTDLMNIFKSSLVFQLYGSTEMGAVSVLWDKDHRSYSKAFIDGSCGKLIIPRENVRIVDVTTREIVTKPNMEGEVQVKIVAGAFKYLNDIELTEKEFHSKDGFFFTR